MAKTITRCGIVVPESRFYHFVMFGKVDFFQTGKISRRAVDCGYVDEWQGNTEHKWQGVARIVERTINEMLPYGEGEISIQCGYREWGESEKGKVWTVKEWRAMITGCGQTELLLNQLK